MQENYFYEPGFWVLVGLLLSGVINCISGLAMGRNMRRFSTVVDEIASDANCLPADKVWLSVYLEEATSSTHWKRLAAFPYLSLMAPFSTFSALQLHCGEARSTAVEDMRNATRRLETERMRSALGSDFAGASLWNDPRRVELAKLGAAVQRYNSPFLSLFMYLCFLPSYGATLMLAGCSWVSEVGQCSLKGLCGAALERLEWSIRHEQVRLF